MLKRKKKKETCAYCGKKRFATRDHIPPRNIFPKPRSSDLITVPCCEKCRRGWSKDDEYFRNAILLQVSAYDPHSPWEQKMLDSLSRPQSKGLLREHARELTGRQVTNENGILLPQFSVFEPILGRLNRVAERIIRGLFYHQKSYPVPKNYRVDAATLQDGIGTAIEDLRDKLLAYEPTSKCAKQQGDFAYCYWEMGDFKDGTAWLAAFYRVPVNLIGFTVPRSQQSPLSPATN